MLDQFAEIFKDFGLIGLLILAVLDSFILPVPTEALFIPLGLANPDLVLWYAFLTTIASLIGAAGGYLLGLKGGKPVLKRIFKADDIKKMENLFAKHGTMAIVVAGFSPFPYKVATITSGAFGVSFRTLMFWSLVSRGTRFLLLAIIIIFMGEAARSFLLSPQFVYLLVVITIVGLLLYGLYWMVKQASKKRS